MTVDAGPVRVLVVMPLGRVGSNLLTAYLGGFKRSLGQHEGLQYGQSAAEQRQLLAEFFACPDADSPRLIFWKQNVRSLADPAAIESLAGELGVSVICMFRKDIVRMAVSHLRARSYARKTALETGQELWGLPTGEQQLGPTPIDIGELDRLIVRHEAMTERLANLFLQCRHLDIEYADLAADIPATMGRVSDFLGIETMAFSPPASRKRRPRTSGTS